jgi:hypothetical protein
MSDSSVQWEFVEPISLHFLAPKIVDNVDVVMSPTSAVINTVTEMNNLFQLEAEGKIEPVSGYLSLQMQVLGVILTRGGFVRKVDRQPTTIEPTSAKPTPEEK